jgi:hypothetical protein
MLNASTQSTVFIGIDSAVRVAIGFSIAVGDIKRVAPKELNSISKDLRLSG